MPRTAPSRRTQSQEELQIIPRGQRSRPLVLLVDGYSLFFRAYFVLAAIERVSMKAPDGTPTNALYAFTGMLLNAIEMFNPDKLMVCMDAHGPVFRSDIYADYKGHRDEPPEDLAVQLELVRPYLEDTGIPWVECAGYEADDLLGTLARTAVVAGCEVAIITGDRDALQLVSPDVTVYMMRIGTSEMKRYDPAAVQEKYGVTPEQFVDYKALLGDTSDNIPGVRGIGEKTAAALLTQYPSVEALLDHLAEIKPEGARKKLEEGREDAILSKRLSAIACDCPVDLDWKTQPDYRFEPARFAGWFGRLGFRTLAQRFGVTPTTPPPPPLAAPGPEEMEIIEVAAEAAVRTNEPVQVEIIQSIEALKALIKQIRVAKEFALDFETTSLNPRNAGLVGIAISVDGRTGSYIPVGHKLGGELLLNTPQEGDCENLPEKEVLALLTPLFEDPKIRKVVQNGKYEYAVMRHYGIHLANMAFDTYVASYILDPDQRHNLKDMALYHLDLHWGRIEDLIGTGKHQKCMNEVGIEECAGYAAHDAAATQRLKTLFEPEIKEAGLDTLFYNVEIPLVPLLSEMEDRGIRVDPDVLAELDAMLAQRLGELEILANEATGGKALNLNSPKQLQEFLFRDLQLPDIKKGSTDIEVLMALREAHPLVPIIIENREVAKLRGTYTQGLLALIEPDGRIHTSYNQGVAATGRLSSANPNLQNIPIRTEQGRRIRKAFIPTDADHVLISADYSQIELRLLAHYTQDEALVEVYRSGGDIHTQTAVEVLGMDPEHPDPEKRRRAKVINFGIIYGMGAFSLAKELEISQSEAATYISNYFARFPGVKQYFDRVLAEGKDKGYVETFLGRRRFFADLKSNNQMKFQMAKRAAINMPLQGGASDLIKMAMVQVAPQCRGLDTSLLLQVHDELVFEAPKARLDEAIACI
ncbi:MAG TPA: DNA polymerase I, partial [bacterium]|nr:DNA polymerase I [bacterium]